MKSFKDKHYVTVLAKDSVGGESKGALLTKGMPVAVTVPNDRTSVAPT